MNVNDDFRVTEIGRQVSVVELARRAHALVSIQLRQVRIRLPADAKLELQLEKGDYEVLQVDGLDDASGTVFFTSNQGDPRQTQLFSVKVDGSGMTQLSKDEGWHTAGVSDDGKYYTDSFSRTNKPPSMSFCASGGTCQKIWEGRSLADYDLVEPKYLEFKADDGTVLYGFLLLPPNPTGRVPLIVDIYGGPAGQTVTKAWEGSTGLFHQLLLNQGYAIFSVDNRGTPNRGRKFSAAIRHQFGGVELKDQLTALDQLLPQFPLLDPNRIGIWGWSNGASMTLYALTHSERYKAGIAVAPVSSWRDYDSIYTERYLGLGRIIRSATTIRSQKQQPNCTGRSLLAHGTSDDNVHLQNRFK